jgi:hypothetical protein
MKTLPLLGIALILGLSFASAVVVSEVATQTLFPGSSSRAILEIKNTLSEDIEDVSVTLDLTNLPFTTLGSSEDSHDEINEDDEEDFTFNLKANSNIEPGDYNIPYEISYTFKNDKFNKKGTFGIRVSSKTEISYSVETENPIINQLGQVSLKITNTGFGDIKFVTVKFLKNSDFNLLSSEEVYIGTVDSDDFETATFNVFFNKINPVFKAQVDYKDFDNKLITENIELPVKLFTREEALELGVIQDNSTPIYISMIITLILAWILYRTLRKLIRKRKKDIKGE